MNNKNLKLRLKFKIPILKIEKKLKLEIQTLKLIFPTLILEFATLRWIFYL